MIEEGRHERNSKHPQAGQPDVRSRRRWIKQQSSRSNASNKSETEVAGSSPPGDPQTSLQRPNRKGVRPLDQTIYLFSQQTASDRDGRSRDRPIFINSGNRRASQRIDAKSGVECIVVSLQEVLSKTIGLVEGVVRAKRPQRLPVVLTKDEVRHVIDHMTGLPRLMAILLYGGGLRLMECCRLRVKDIDFSRNEIVIRAVRCMLLFK
jgi:Phage integrase family